MLRAHISPGMNVVDAGANIGIYSAFLSSLVGATGRVHSFEPSAENFAKLERTARHRPNIVCNRAALGAASQEMHLYLSGTLNVDHRMYPTPGEDRREVLIRCVALDDYFSGSAPVDFIKMDIQGYELTALQGADRIIAENPKIKLMLEFWPYGLKASGVEPVALPEFLSERGFRVEKIDGRGRGAALTEFDYQIDESIYCNLFATRGLLSTRPASARGLT